MFPENLKSLAQKTKEIFSEFFNFRENCNPYRGIGNFLQNCL